MKKFELQTHDYDFSNEYTFTHPTKSNQDFNNDIKEVLNFFTDKLIEKAVYNFDICIEPAPTRISVIMDIVEHKLVNDYGYEIPKNDTYVVAIDDNYNIYKDDDGKFVDYNHGYKEIFTEENLNKIIEHNKRYMNYGEGDNIV